MQTWKLLAIVVPACLAVDLLWLGVVMNGFYSRELGDLIRRNGTSMAPRWPAAFLVYLLIPVGIVLFVRPLLNADSSLWNACAWGALFGLVVYGVYDLTNLAVLEKWTLRMTLADIAWGCVLCGSMSALMLVADRWLTK